MSLWASALAFLFALPFSVWLLANLAAVIDEPDKAKPLVRLTLSVCAVLVVLMLTDRSLLTALGIAFGIVAFLHLVTFYLLRYRLLGAPIYEEQPPEIPLVDDKADER